MALFRLKKDTENEKPEVVEASSNEKATAKPEQKPNQKTEQKTKKKSEAVKTSTKPMLAGVDYEKNISGVLLRPRITEKSTIQAEKKVFVFDVAPQANKRDVKEAIEKIYRVVPVKVNMIKVPSKKVRSKSRNTFGTKSGGKKAFVYLKDGDTINIV